MAVESRLVLTRNILPAQCQLGFLSDALTAGLPMPSGSLGWWSLPRICSRVNLDASFGCPFQAFPCPTSTVIRLAATRKPASWLDAQNVAAGRIGVTSLPAIKLLLATRWLGVPCVVSERNFPPSKRIGRLWSGLRRLSYPWAALHLVQTQAVGMWMKTHLGAHQQLLLPNPVQWPLTRFRPSLDPHAWLSSRGCGSTDPVLLAVGTKADQKGFDRLVRWWIPLAQADARLQLVIVGLDERPYHGRDQQADLRALLVDQPELQARLHFPGRVGNLADWYARTQIFVLSSRYEGFPNVLLEAMAAGCCCVAADCPQGPADLIQDGVNGCLLPAAASDAQWVQLLRTLLTDVGERQRLAANAVEVRELYAPAALQQRLTQALECLVGEAAQN